MASYEKINYSLRQAKAIERKMLCDAMRRLSLFHKIENYQYIGFGSTFFVDFSTFHKSLGIDKMISIEREKEDADRFAFNLPFSCIDLRIGNSEDILPVIDWSSPSIVWLDYDNMLESYMLNDLRTFFENAISGSMVIISAKAHHESPFGLTGKDLDDKRFENFRERLKGYDIPAGISGKDLNLKKMPITYYKILNSYVKRFISDSNIKRIANEKLNFKQIFNITYQDGAQMYTFGGIVLNKGHNTKFKNAKFNDLEYVRTSNDIFKIEVPSLTFKEINFLNSLLPFNINPEGSLLKPENELIRHGIPTSSISQYYKIYRYFPTYTETLL
jgi:hypothetical protein